MQFGLGLDEIEELNYLDSIPNPEGRKSMLQKLADLGFELWTNAFRGSRYN